MKSAKELLKSSKPNVPKKTFDALSDKERLKKCVDLLPDLLGHWEDTHPYWRLEVLFWLLDGALKSLRHYIELASESEISWESPFVELHFPVECTWESDDPENTLFRLTSGQLNAEEMVNQEAASKALSKLVVQHLHIVALQDYTNGTAFEKRGETLMSVLDPNLVEHVREHIPEERQEQEIKRLFWPKSFGAGTIDYGELKEGEEISEEVIAQLEAVEEPLLALPIEIDGRKLRVITIFEVHPLIANADTKNGYFPLTVGLAIQWDKDDSKAEDGSLDLTWASFPNWPNKTRKALWNAFAKLLEIKLGGLGPKAEPEMEEAVITVNAQIRVTVPKGNTDQLDQAKLEMLEHFRATGEVLSFDVRSGRGLLTNTGQIERLQLLLASVDEAKTAADKGKTLESLVAALFASVPGFSVMDRIRTKSEEIDIWVSNNCECRPFRDEGDVILVECKRWSGKCGKNEFGPLYEKIKNRKGRCTIGFLISWNGFAGTFTTEMLRASREAPLIVPIDGTLIRKATQSGDFLATILEARERALMV